MGERGVRNAEVRGSIPLISTYPSIRKNLLLYPKWKDGMLEYWKNGFWPSAHRGCGYIATVVNLILKVL